MRLLNLFVVSSFIAVSGHLKTGDLIAILGGSGAGKTTLLAAISQRLRGNLTGDVVLNGLAMDRHQMTRISSFLPQFEINVKTFTAYEHLYFMVGVNASSTVHPSPNHLFLVPTSSLTSRCIAAPLKQRSVRGLRICCLP